MGGCYWWIEFLKVLLAYIVLVFVYPTILFRNYLRGKGRTFWFGFCVTGSVMLVSTVVIALGLVHFLHGWVVRILFYGSLLWSVGKSMHMPMTARYLVYKMRNGTYGGKLFAVRFWEAVAGTVRRGLNGLWRVVRKNALELAVLSVLVAYGVLYFSWNSIHTYGYGFSDIIVHHQWVDGLRQGEVFSAGVYPQAMHCVAYAVSTLFGIDLYSVMLFLQCANNITLFVAIYLFGREIAHWKGSALVMLAAFLTIRVDRALTVEAVARLQASLPQEFGLYTVFLIPVFLIRYLKNAGQVSFRGKKTRCFWDRNLIVFFLGIAASVSIHFYVTIMAVFACLGVIVVWFLKIVHWRRLIPLAMSAILAVVVSFGPMVVAVASGIPFQSSIYWALNQMTLSQEEPSVPNSGVEESRKTEGSADQDSQMPVVTEPEQQSISRIWNAVLNRFRQNWDGLIRYGYGEFFAEQWAWVFSLLGFGVLGAALVYRLAAAVLHRFFRQKRFPTDLLDRYAMLGIITVVFMLAYAANATDFPKLVEYNRVCAVLQIFMMCLLVLPVDFAGLLLSRYLGGKGMSVLSAAAVAAVFCLVISGGYYHGYLCIGASRFNAAVDVTNSILKNTPKEQFTIVSTTDELYQVIGKGFHEEMLTFQNNCEQQEYYLPTRYLFFYLEKTPIRYWHYHFSDGPQWLAQQSYTNYFNFSSVGDEMSVGETSDEIAEKEPVMSDKLSDAYSIIFNREIVESKMARYLREFEERYPNELNVYYEDENFICYCLEQKPERLFNLGRQGS